MTIFGDYALDRYVGTDLSKFTHAEIPDLCADGGRQEHWIGNYVLNSLDGGFTSPIRQRAYYFLRRTQAAFDEWAQARQATITYLDERARRVLQYVKAIGHWEAALSNC